VLVVRRQLLQVGGVHPCPYCPDGHRSMAWARPKTASGEDRLVDLDSHTVGVLLEQRLRQDTDRERWGDAYAEHGLVFAHEDGTPLNGDEVTKRFGALCAAAGVRRVRLHDLRHGAASLRLAAGADIALVSKLLGHSSIGITADTHSHLLSGVGRDVAERAAALIPRAPRATGGLPTGSQASPHTDEAVSDGENLQVSEGEGASRLWESNPRPTHYECVALAN